MELLTDASALPYDEKELRIQPNIVYAEQPNKQVRLDLFLPKDKGSAVPCIISIHCGGFRVHWREWFAGHAASFARARYASVVINYRKEPGIDSRLDPVLDTNAAIRWVGDNAKSYGIDPDRIGVFGGSAGNPGVSCAVQAVVTCARSCMRLDLPVGREPDEGVTSAICQNERALMEKFSPYEQVDPTAPPILILHGSADKVVALFESEDLSSRYQKVGLMPQLEIQKGNSHTFHLSQETVDRAVRFFREAFQ